MFFFKFTDEFGDQPDLLIAESFDVKGLFVFQPQKVIGGAAEYIRQFYKNVKGGEALGIFIGAD